MDFKASVLQDLPQREVEDPANSSKRGSSADWQLSLWLLLPPGASCLCCDCCEVMQIAHQVTEFRNPQVGLPWRVLCKVPAGISISPESGPCAPARLSPNLWAKRGCWGPSGVSVRVVSSGPFPRDSPPCPARWLMVIPSHCRMFDVWPKKREH